MELTDAAVDDGLSQLQLAAIGHEAVVDLGGQFSSGGQDQCTRSAAHELPVVLLGPWSMFDLGQGKTMEDRQGEGTGLACSGLGSAQNVVAFECRGNGSSLDFGGGVVALVRNGTNDGLCELKCREINWSCFRVVARQNLPGTRGRGGKAEVKKQPLRNDALTPPPAVRICSVILPVASLTRGGCYPKLPCVFA